MSDRFDPEVSPEEGSSAVLADPIGVLTRRWKWMLAALSIGALASVGLSIAGKPRFAAEATVLVAPQNVSERIVEPTIQEDSLSRIEALAAEVLSRANLARLIDEFALYPELRERVTMGEIVQRVRADVSIRPVERTQSGERLSARAYTIGFQASSPDAAAGVANALATLFVDTSFAERHRQHQLTSEFLRRELAEAERLLREQNRKIAEFKQENRSLLPSDLQPNLTRLDLLQNQRQSLALQIAEAGTRVATLVSDDKDSPDSRLETLRDDLARLRATQTPRHPDIIELQRQISELERQRATAPAPEASSPRALQQAAEQTLAVLRQQLAGTERGLTDLDARIGRMPAVQEELASLEEKELILRETYLEFLRKVQDAELDENLLMAQQGERVSVLNPAEPASQPIRGRWQYLAFGLIASLGFAVVLGLALEFADPVVLSPEHVVQLTGLPTLGSVGRIR